MARLEKTEQAAIALAGALQIAAGILAFAAINEKNWTFLALCVLSFLGGGAYRFWLTSNAERRAQETENHKALTARIAHLEAEVKRLRTSAPNSPDQPYDLADHPR